MGKLRDKWRPAASINTQWIRALLNAVRKVHPDEVFEDEETGEVEIERLFFLVIGKAWPREVTDKR